MDKIKVLWIDDECMDAYGKLTFMGKQFTGYAYEQGIDIIPMSSYAEGMRAIENNPSEWCAVILDIREQRATDGNAADGYTDMYYWLQEFHIKHGQEEPYIFTLSGEKQYQGKDTTIRKERYSSKKVYDKNKGDYLTLFEDIRKIENVSTLYQIQCKYKDALEASASLGKEARERLIKIIWQIQKKENEPQVLNEMRKYIEDFPIRKMEAEGYFPFDCVTLNDRSRIIGDKKNTIPEYIKRSFHSLVSITQEGSHGRTVIDNDVRQGKAPYLLRSCAFELLNIIYWMKDISYKET